jgi:hypothetical protein
MTGRPHGRQRQSSRRSLRFESLEGRRLLAVTLLDAPAADGVIIVSPKGPTSPLPAVMDRDVPSLQYDRWGELTPAQVPLLTTTQIATVPNNYFFAYEWSNAHRLAMTFNQVRALNIPVVGIGWLPGSLRPGDTSPPGPHIGWLTLEQIAQVSVQEVPQLLQSQIPYVTPAQFRAMINTFPLSEFTDATLANLTRAQLISLPVDVLSQVMSVERTQFPPETYHPPHPFNPGLPSDTLGPLIFPLVPTTQVTHKAVASGLWTSSTTWENGNIPAANAHVYIPENLTVTYNKVAGANEALRTLRIDGTLQFATAQNTVLRVDTIVVFGTGHLYIGTANAPIASNVTAQVIIPNGGPINTTWDRSLVSRGLISRGEVQMFGRAVTSHATLLDEPAAGAMELRLTEPPVDWRPDDVLVLAGTDISSEVANFGSERVQIQSINGTRVMLKTPLQFAHQSPDGFSVQVANLNRNIKFLSEGDPTKPLERPHIAFFDNPDVHVENILVQGFGRTDKSKLIAEPVNGIVVPGITNPRARYALHFHHTGVNPNFDPAIVRGSVVDGSPGWGYVNHQGNVTMERNVSIDVFGAGFVGEDGNEIGVMRGNLALNAKGSGQQPENDFREAIHDFGHGGHGFWFQGPGIEVVDNVAAGSAGSGFGYFTASNRVQFDALNLLDPTTAGMNDAVPVGAVPLRPFRNNMAYTTHQGLEIWFHQTNLTDGESVVENFKAWNTNIGIRLPYTAHVTVRNSTLYGPSFQGILFNPTTVGFRANHRTHDIVLDNVEIRGYETGILAPMRRSTVLQNMRLGNLVNLVIAKGHDSIRRLHANAPITFIPVPGRTTVNVRLVTFATSTSNADRKVASLFAADDLRIALNDGTIARLYPMIQAATTVPFLVAVPSYPAVAPYVGKSNLQLSETDGVWYNGGALPSGTTTVPGIEGAVAVVRSATPQGDLDDDGEIDGNDFLMWQRGVGRSRFAVILDGDADRDRDVDGGDLALLRANFGARRTATASFEATAAPMVTLATPPVAAAAATPLPTSALSPVTADAALAYELATSATLPRKMPRSKFIRRN